MRLTSTITTLMLLGAAAAAAQRPARPCPAPAAPDPRAVIDTHRTMTYFEQPEHPPENDPLATHLFAPELIMAHQRRPRVAG